jgi:ADP-ribose pyrophosphatase YjhB (NUDIX family)
MWRAKVCNCPLLHEGKQYSDGATRLMLAIVDRLDKRRVAAFIRRMPWTGHIAQAVWRLWQPWVTVGVVGAIFDDEGRILLVEHVFHPLFPWGLPGGWMLRNENPDETVRREVYEETGLRIDVLKPLLIARTPYLSRHLDMAYLCRAQGGDIRLSSELLAYDWVDPLRTPPMAVFHQHVLKAALAERRS